MVKVGFKGMKAEVSKEEQELWGKAIGGVLRKREKSEKIKKRKELTHLRKKCKKGDTLACHKLKRLEG